MMCYTVLVIHEREVVVKWVITKRTLIGTVRNVRIVTVLSVRMPFILERVIMFVTVCK